MYCLFTGYTIDPEKSGTVRIGRKLLNATTAAPPAVVEEKSFIEKVEEFYEDKNNFAMYLVLPCIVLVYGGCAAIYCCYKCRQQLCSKKKNKKDPDGDETDDECNDIKSRNNDKVSLVSGSPNNPGKKAAAMNQIRPASKASVSDVNVGMGQETPLPWAIPDKEEIKKQPPAYSEPPNFQTNHQANMSQHSPQSLQNFNTAQPLQPNQLQGMQQQMPFNQNAYQLQMMQHPNAMYQPTIIPVPMPYPGPHVTSRRRRPSREDSYIDSDDYDSLPRNLRKQGKDRRNSNHARSGKPSRQNDFSDSDNDRDADHRDGQGRRRSSPNSRDRYDRESDRRNGDRGRRRSDDREAKHRGYSPSNPRDRQSREDTLSARSDRRRRSPDRRSDDRGQRNGGRDTKDRGRSPSRAGDRSSREDTMSPRSDRRRSSPDRHNDDKRGRSRHSDPDSKDRGYSPTNPKNRPSREDTMSARSDRRRSSPDRPNEDKRGRDRHSDPDSKDRGYSPTNPRERPSREDTMSARSDKQRKPRKINEVKPTPQQQEDRQANESPQKENSPTKRPPPRPTQPKKSQNGNQQDDRIMSPPPPYEGHERRNSLDAVFEASENKKGPARPSYNPKPTIRVISQTKGGGPVSGVEMAKQAAEMLRVDNPNMGARKKPKRLVFVAE